MLSVFSAVLLCAHSLSALADSGSATNTATSTEQIRVQVEAKRDQLTGVANVSTATEKGPSAVLDAPVVTDDAPAQAQRP
ncbi:hypothetical protein NLO88_02670 [Pseudomonas syringae]|nr:hypothetical protein [Pseudomonas syringae]MCQ2998899.1 hypothetical protein [Pseudomonas syringae]MCQ3029554.1 hypothetical protein [Pseudomonas syringae]MDG6401435.1 hypothetical protein [Pseudomonas quasicaspiana]